MNKTTDINERTLEKEKKSFVTFCEVAEGFLSVGLVFMIIVAIGVLFLLIITNTMKGGALSEVLDGDYTTPENIFNGIFRILTCIGVSISLNFGIKVFKTLKDGNTPFRYEIADKIKAAGMALIGTGIVYVILETVNGFLNAAGVFKDEVSLSFDFDFFIWGAMILAIAYIFNYGCKLQQESDETI